ncbi:MAG: DUF4843 domain-containing protein [Pedobacter sp.]|nr:MAG: DUF4843 domain-containing protein [Pedobacter sp.]
MKKLFLYILAIQIFAAVGCKKEDMSYKGTEGVYFAVQFGKPTFSLNYWPYMPYSKVEFVSLAADVVDFPIKVMITGPIKDYDRTFRIAVNPDSTTAILGQHYDAIQEEWKIPAGAVSTNITVHFKRTPDLEVNQVTLGLRIVPTKDFVSSFPEWDALPQLSEGDVIPKFDAGMHTLRINDIMVQPVVWPGSLQPGNRESGLFGVFTKRKMQFLIDNLGLKYEDFASTETMPQARYLLVASDATLILKQRLEIKDPVLEEDGRLMFIGSVPWTSIIGVPYKP